MTIFLFFPAYKSVQFKRCLKKETFFPNELHPQAHPCYDYCLDIAKMCFNHFKEAADVWENYVTMTTRVFDSMDMFAAAYERSIHRTSGRIQKILKSKEIAEHVSFKCGLLFLTSILLTCCFCVINMRTSLLLSRI